jgi:hypothetical protein
MFFKKGRGALWVCIWNQGGGGPKKFGNHCCRASSLGTESTAVFHITLKHFSLQRTLIVACFILTLTDFWTFKCNVFSSLHFEI